MYKSILKSLTYTYIVLFFISLFGCSQLSSTTQNSHTTFNIPKLKKDSTLTFDAENKKLTQGIETVNFHTLRWSYRNSRYYTLSDARHHQVSIAMSEAIQQENYTLCIQLAEATIKEDYINLAAHFSAYICYLNEENTEKSNFHLKVTRGLMKSINESGDGLTADSAFITISASEMRNFIEINGWYNLRQEIISVGPKDIEKVYLVNPLTEEVTQWFFNNSAAIQPLISPIN